MSTTTKTPDTITTQIGHLSFVTETRTKRGRWISWNHFDVAPETYMEGILTGKRLALELMLDMKANPETYQHTTELRHILADVAKATEEARAMRQRVFDTPTREGAAVGFMGVVIQYFAFGVRSAEVHKHMAGVIENQVQSNKTMADYDAKRKAQSIATGIATRRANKALKAAGSTV